MDDGIAELETVTARELWDRLRAMGQAKYDYLDGHEFHVSGQWRTFDDAGVDRNPGTPLVLYVEYPRGEHRVPMGAEILVRPRGEA